MSTKKKRSFNSLIIVILFQVIDMWKINDTTIKLNQGDITEYEGDAILNYHCLKAVDSCFFDDCSLIESLTPSPQA